MTSTATIGLTQSEFTALLAAVAAFAQEAIDEREYLAVDILMMLMSKLSDARKDRSEGFSVLEVKALMLICRHGALRLSDVPSDVARRCGAELQDIGAKLEAIMPAETPATAASNVVTLVQPSSKAVN
tara:strand:+ start:422 stop:805 length:384 start_codon:yes stop_codon:yes gene_type:complete